MAEALLGRKLDGMKIMRIEAQRARDVVDGKKTLELTGKRCHKRGLVLITEKAKGATSPSCVIGAVTLGECDRISSLENFEATADRPRALGSFSQLHECGCQKHREWSPECSSPTRQGSEYQNPRWCPQRKQ